MDLSNYNIALYRYGELDQQIMRMLPVTDSHLSAAFNIAKRNVNSMADKVVDDALSTTDGDKLLASIAFYVTNQDHRLDNAFNNWLKFSRTHANGTRVADAFVMYLAHQLTKSPNDANIRKKMQTILTITNPALA